MVLGSFCYPNFGSLPGLASLPAPLADPSCIQPLHFPKLWQFAILGSSTGYTGYADASTTCPTVDLRFDSCHLQLEFSFTGFCFQQSIHGLYYLNLETGLRRSAIAVYGSEMHFWPDASDGFARPSCYQPRAIQTPTTVSLPSSCIGCTGRERNLLRLFLIHQNFHQSRFVFHSLSSQRSPFIELFFSHWNPVLLQLDIISCWSSF